MSKIFFPFCLRSIRVIDRSSSRHNPERNLRWSACRNPGVSVFEIFYPGFQIICLGQQIWVLRVRPKIRFCIAQANPKVKILSFEMLNAVSILPGLPKQYIFFRNFWCFHGFSPKCNNTPVNSSINDHNLICRIVKSLWKNEMLRIKKVNALNTLLSVDGHYVINKNIGDKR